MSGTLASPEHHGSMPLYSLRGIGKQFAAPGETVTILENITLNVHAGESIAVIGASGSGKSTLLHIMGTLAAPSLGDITFCGHDLRALKPDEQARLRNRDIGFVFQFHHLLPEFTTLENVAMQAIIGGVPRRKAVAEARRILELVGLEGRADFNVSLLSGGERQRAAIARAVLQKPKVLLADEPTGNLDEKNGARVAELLARLNAEHHMSMIVVTHNRDLADRMGKCFELKSGDLYEQTR